MRSWRSLFSVFLTFGIGLSVCVAIQARAYADTVNFTEGMSTIVLWDMTGTPSADLTNEVLRGVDSSRKYRMFWGSYSTGDGQSTGTESGTLSLTGTDRVNFSTTEDGYLDPWGYYSYVNFEQSGSQNFFLYPNWNDATRGGEYDSTGTVSGNITVTESGNVSITDNSTMTYTENGINGFYSNFIDGLNASSGSGSTGFEISFGSVAMSTGTKFRVLFPVGTCAIRAENYSTWYNVSLAGIKVWRYYGGNYTQLTNTGGLYECDGPCNAILITFNSSKNLSPLNQRHVYRLTCIPYLLVDVNSTEIMNLTNQTITNTQNVTNTVTQQTQQQTTALKDTSGSDGIVSSAVNSTQNSLVQKLGFVAQIPTIMSEIYQAVTHEGGGTVHFPGVSWEGQTIWPAADVPIVGWMPDSVQNPIRLFNTIVLFLAWMRGVHLIYLRIVRPIDAVIEAVGDEE